MSRYIATRAIRGANALVTEAEVMLQKALKEKVQIRLSPSPIQLITCH
jgi:hypothetical protein